MTGKYDELRETPQELTTIIGKIWTREYLEVTHKVDSLAISIRGFPPCPECGTILAKHFIENYWYCPNNQCLTTYDTSTLVEILLGGNSNGV